MNNIWKALSGYKTYIGGAISIAYALYQYYVAGDMPQAEAAKMVEGALFAMTIRHGIATSLGQFITSLNGGSAKPSAPSQKTPSP